MATEGTCRYPVPSVAEADTITPAPTQDNGLFIEVDGQMVPNYDATLVLFEEGDVVSGQGRPHRQGRGPG